MKKQNLKLFIWDDYNTDYTPGLAFAIAENEEEARDLIRKQRIKDNYNTDHDNWGAVKVLPLNKCAFAVSGGG